MLEDLIPQLLQTLTMKLVSNKLSYETLAWVCLIQGFSQLFQTFQIMRRLRKYEKRTIDSWADV